MCIRDSYRSENAGMSSANDVRIIMAGNLRFLAVSYTHLDVYKRQHPMHNTEMCEILRDVETGGAWLSSARVVRCWVKSRNERNPCHCLLYTSHSVDESMDDYKLDNVSLIK